MDKQDNDGLVAAFAVLGDKSTEDKRAVADAILADPSKQGLDARLHEDSGSFVVTFARTPDDHPDGFDRAFNTVVISNNAPMIPVHSPEQGAFVSAQHTFASLFANPS